MKIDWTQPPEARDALLKAIGMPDFIGPHYWLAVIGDDGSLVAVWAYHNFGPTGCEMSGAVFSRRLVPREVMRALFAYPFHQLGFRRITCTVRPSNTVSLNIVRRMGFRVEGLLRNWYPDDHGILLGLLKEECKWL